MGSTDIAVGNGSDLANPLETGRYLTGSPMGNGRYPT